MRANSKRQLRLSLRPNRAGTTKPPDYRLGASLFETGAQNAGRAVSHGTAQLHDALEVRRANPNRVILIINFDPVGSVRNRIGLVCVGIDIAPPFPTAPLLSAASKHV